MKRFLVPLISIALFGAFAGNSSAARVGGVGAVEDPVGFGSYHARVRWIQPHYGPDGRYYTYVYADIVGTTQTYCENQLSSYTGSGASVVTYCHFVPN